MNVGSYGENKVVALMMEINQSKLVDVEKYLGAISFVFCNAAAPKLEFGLWVVLTCQSYNDKLM